MILGMQSLFFCLLFSSILQATLCSPTRRRRQSQIDHIIKEFINKDFPNGCNNTQISTIHLIGCDDIKKQLTDKTAQFLEKSTYSNQLERDVARLKREIRQLRLKGTCSTDLTAQISKLQVQLEEKMSELEQGSTDNAKLTLRIETLTVQVKELERNTDSKVVNSAQFTALQLQLDEKTRQLNVAKDQLEKNSHKSKLILQIISLINEIWELQKGSPSQTTIDKTTALQRQLEDKINELEDRPNDSSKLVLGLLMLKNDLAELERKIPGLTMAYKAQIADLLKQQEEKNQQLTNKIMLLKGHSDITKLTGEILATQTEALALDKEIVSLKQRADAELAELKKTLNAKENQQEEWTKQLKGKDDSNAELVLTIINLIKETKDRQKDEDQKQTTTGQQITDLQVQLMAKEEELARALEQNKELQRQMREKDAKCSNVQEKYDKAKIELDDKIKELKVQRGDASKLVLQITALNDEVTELKRQIQTPEAEAKIAELQKQLDRKNQQLEIKSKELEEISSNPQRLLRILVLQDQIRGLQGGAANQANSDLIAELQKELDDLVDKMEDRNNDNTKLMLQIISLQNQVAKLKEELSGLGETTHQKNQLRRLLEAKENQLLGLIDELKKKDGAYANQVLTVLDLQNQLRKLQNDAANQSKLSAAEVAALKKQLEVQEEQNSQTQAQNKDLQKKLKDKAAQCSGVQEHHDKLQDDLDDKLKELAKKTDRVNSLILELSSLNDQVKELKARVLTPAAETRIAELQKTLDVKIKELERKTKELEETSSQPQRILKIIAIQGQIADLRAGAANETSFDQIAELERELDDLINGINDRTNDNSKLILRLIGLQNEIARLQKQASELDKTSEDKIAELEDQLEKVNNKLEQKTNEAVESGTRIPGLVAEIMALRWEKQELSEEIPKLKQTSADSIKELQRLLDLKMQQLEDNKSLLEAKDRKNADLIQQIIALQANKKALETEAKKDKDTIAFDVSELKKQLKATEMENRRLDRINKDLEKQQDREMNLLREELRKKDEDMNKLQTECDELKKKKEAAADDKEIKTVRVVLDPDTAHRKLILSHDHTTITVSEAQDVSDNPGRYETSLGVLGKTGFDKGRHYWEVKVPQICYNLGVASRSANRQAVSLRPNSGYITMVSNYKGELVMMGDRRVNLGIPPVQPTVVGVLFEYEKGEVTFYDANARTLIYKMGKYVFKETWFPFFSACADYNNPIDFSPVLNGVSWIKT